MRLTTKSRYGARAIFDIAYHSTGVPIQIKDISERQEIPPRYLEQIFHKLKKANIVKSVRGPGGGYVLAKDPQRITIGDVIQAVREPIDPVYCVDDGTERNEKCSRAEKCVTRLVWKEAGEEPGRTAQEFESGEVPSETGLEAAYWKTRGRRTTVGITVDGGQDCPRGGCRDPQ